MLEHLPNLLLLNHSSPAIMPNKTLNRSVVIWRFIIFQAFAGRTRLALRWATLYWGQYA
jgi:hypothetical protein